MVPFSPSAGRTVNIDVSGSNQTVKVADDGRRREVRVMNNGTATVWITFGTSSAVASLTTSWPVGPGVTEVINVCNKSNEALYAAAIAAGSTGKIYFTPGIGI